MSCPGLHCPGCSEGQSLAILGGTVAGLVVAAETVQWVAQRIWWIGSTVAVCFVLAGAAGMWLERLADRRGARFTAAHGILSRADVIAPCAVRAEVVPPAIAPAQAVITGGTHIWVSGLPDAEQARAIRQALTAQAGDTSPEGSDLTALRVQGARQRPARPTGQSANPAKEAPESPERIPHPVCQAVLRHGGDVLRERLHVLGHRRRGLVSRRGQVLLPLGNVGPQLSPLGLDEELFLEGRRYPVGAYVEVPLVEGQARLRRVG